jgi:hypothetical protein
MRFKTGGLTNFEFKTTKSNISPKQKVGLAMQKLEKLMRIKN